MTLDDPFELVKDYLEEASEFLDTYEGFLLQLEQEEDPDPGLVAEILGALHTFKGNSGMMGYAVIQKYTHKLEDLFKALQSGSLELERDLIEYVMHSVGVLRRTISQITPKQPDEPQIAGDIQHLDKLLAQKVNMVLASPSLPAAGTQEIRSQFPKKTNVIKVDFERLDHLMNLMGELVIYRTRLGQVDTTLKRVMGEKGVSLELSAANEQIGKVSTELHEAIMRVRMLPIRNIFMRFPRFVRDFARDKGKEVTIQFDGEDTELDKSVIDEIGEPLLHLIRNAIDHGIETPEERKKGNKNPQGTIAMRAYQESSHIVISVEDDGKGIDEKNLKKKAIDAGLFSEAESEQKYLIDLIFLPGMSTAEQVTEVSGRGIGMDVVKKSLAKINGSIEVETRPNQGTRFTIKLPLTLAIISALMVKVGEEQYAIPLISVLESIRVQAHQIHEVNNREVIKVRDQILPLVHLSHLFHAHRSHNGKNLRVVIVQSTVGKMGIVVDSLMGQQDIVIKALDDYLGKSTGVAGATILGDGRVVLILDVPTLMEQMRGFEIKENGDATREVIHA